MSDYFHQQAGERKYVGPGGAKCACCMPYGSRKRLNRATRRTLRQSDHRAYPTGKLSRLALED